MDRDAQTGPTPALQATGQFRVAELPELGNHGTLPCYPLSISGTAGME